MSDALTTFFDAWSEQDASKRANMIASATSPDATYSDPRSGDRLSGHAAISDYVGMFSANAPGWTAKVVSTDEVNGYARSAVAFGGMGPDGNEMTQHGTYFSEADDAGKLVMIAGFVGLGFTPDV
ncbi:SnoaL-like domain-containing protein [Octadecabacter temperatus]|uniref:SnoaL-like domain protein n=1 Tax=Octadecabacter temperatus TaxID=1458307 RepID=A0A0K0Y2A3_9RHOB|nr:nuclear transport factor 2 family protein [Octadecabacter temperatus]AKS45065.1 SnoaL-like domain protein [Octadecabacter temperatus]SIN85518.1 SnoaL-like domain-containing protein [Octadecabacter temperatus]